MGYFEKSIEALQASDAAGEHGANATFQLLRAIVLALQAIAAETSAIAGSIGALQESMERQQRGRR